jgi:hypothetical protein
MYNAFVSLGADIPPSTETEFSLRKIRASKLEQTDIKF